MGQAIFAAGSGLIGISGVLRTLEEECDAIWKKRVNTTSAWHIANRSLQIALQSVRDNGIRPRDWLQAKEHIDKFQGQRTDLNQQRVSLQSEEKINQRIRRLAGPLRRRNEFETMLGGRVVPPLSEAQECAFDSALQALATTQRACDSAEDLLISYREQLAAVQHDPPVLTLSDEIGELLEDRGAIRKALSDLPKRDAELAAQQSAVTELLHELHLPELTLEDLAATLPSRVSMTHLRELARDRQMFEVTLENSRGHIVELNAREAALDALLLQAKAPEGLSLLKLAVASARKLGLLDASCREAQRKHANAQRKYSDLLPRLKPWTGDSAALRALVAPASAIIEEHRDRLDTASEDVALQASELVGLGQSAAQNRLDRANLLRLGRAVTIDELQSARLSRDGAWRALRAHLLGEQVIQEVGAAAVEFEGYVAAVDSLADERYLSAQASAQLVVLDNSFAKLQLNVEQVQSRQVAAQSEQEEAGEAWNLELRTRGLPEVSPVHLQEWMMGREAALTAGSATDEARQTAEEAEQQRSDAITHLSEAILPDKRLATSPNSFAYALEHAEFILTDLSDQQSLFDQRSNDLGAAQIEVATASAKLVSQSAESEAKGLIYKKAIKEAGLSGLPGSSVLDLYEELRAKTGTAGELSHRIAGIGIDTQRFESRVAEAARQLNIPGEDTFPLLDDLKRRLSQANAQEQSAVQITASESKSEGDLRAGEAQRLAAEASFAPVAAIAGVTDKESLEAFVADSREVRQRLADLEEVRREILQNGDGLSLDVLISESIGSDQETLEERSRVISGSVADLDEKLSGVATDLGAAQEAFRAIDKGPVAVCAAADAELARAEMEMQAEEYLLKRSEAVLLRRLIERQRQTQESPLLRRAGVLFRKLTLERYAGLVIDSEESTPKLLGLSQNGAGTVPLEGMSDGTKDQLYLSLRVAAIEQSLADGVTLPFLADDLFINYDDNRARAGIEVLAELSRSTQVLFFTHHQRLVEIARDVLGAATLQTCTLQ